MAALPLGSRALARDGTVPPPDGAPETIEPSALARANVEALRLYYDALNRGDLAQATLSFAPDTKNHGRIVGRTGLSRVLTDLRTMFPDYRHDLVEITATGDVVVSRNRVSGTHKGVGRIPVEGGKLVGVPPTGRSFVVQHIHWWRFANGLIVEHYATRDDLDMMEQLGLLALRSAQPPRSDYAS
ncbi:ester cyclase [Sphingomonas sp.]|uniref:ester cyclase n=1 Tax=Sphingomonas sp. TaxID=28214 RepID=UPI0025F75140|nr:ester cyclase [Sphingomonas sp.]